MEEKGKENGKEAKISPDKFAALAQIAAQLCEVVVMCAPAFGAGSRGAEIVAMAVEVRPRLAELLEGLKKESEKEGGKTK